MPNFHQRWPILPASPTTLPLFRDTLETSFTGGQYKLLGGWVIGIDQVPHEVPLPVQEACGSSTTDSDESGRSYYCVCKRTHLRYTPQFGTVKELIRWLWFAHAKEYFADAHCNDCDAEPDGMPHDWYQVVSPNGLTDMPLCDNCRDNHFALIASSRRYIMTSLRLENGIESFSNHQVWTHNAFCDRNDMEVCDHCEDNIPTWELTDTWEGDCVCSSCVGEDYVYCEDTEHLHHRDNCTFYPRHDGWYYDTDNAPASSVIRGYSANVLEEIGHECFINNSAVHLRNAGDALLFGVELETDRRGGYDPDEIAQAAMDAGFGPYGIAKEDSTCTGPEFVSLPCDLESHIHAVRWQEVCEALRPIAKGHHGRDNGMHIHMSKAALPKLVLGKMLVFFNNSIHAPFLEMISQRPLGSWCPQHNQPKLKKVGRAGNDPYLGKYAILNTTNSTVECRMFNSTLLHERIYKNLEFLHASVQWCKNTSASTINKLDDSSGLLVEFIHNHKVDYPHLSQFISNRFEA